MRINHAKSTDLNSRNLSKNLHDTFNYKISNTYNNETKTYSDLILIEA